MIEGQLGEKKQEKDRLNNKNTVDTLFAPDLPGGKLERTYDENGEKAQRKEAAAKAARKGATVAVTRPKSKVPTKK